MSNKFQDRLKSIMGNQFDEDYQRQSRLVELIGELIAENERLKTVIELNNATMRDALG